MKKQNQSTNQRKVKTAVIYARYSSENQTEQSIEGQMRVCEEYAKSNNILILNSYIDRAMTGTNDNRPAFQKMMKDSSNGEWDYVLVYKFDRFSRNKYETAMHKKTLKDNGVKLRSATEYLPDTPEAIIMESMFEGYAEYYSAELSQKVKRGMNETRLKGNFTGGFLIYGYKIVDKKIYIDEEKAEVVRYIFKQFSLGIYVKDIIKELTSKGILYRGKPFLNNTVYNMLKNEKYAGIYRYGNQVFDNMYPRIVPQDIFDRVRKIIEKNKIGSRSPDIIYLLRNKAKCGYCGKSICAETGTARSGEVKHYYKCLGKKKGSNCCKTTFKKDEIEAIIIDFIVEQLSQEDVIDKIVNTLLDCQENQDTNKALIKVLENEKRQSEIALENIVKAVEKGLFTTTTNKRIQELEEKIEELEKALLVEKSKIAVKLSEEDIREYYKGSLELNARMLMNYIVKEIVFFNEEIEIHFNTPTKSPDESQGFCFLETKYIDYIMRMFV